MFYNFYIVFLQSLMLVGGMESTSLEFCILALSGNYKQTRTMSCGPTAAAEMVKRISNQVLEPAQMGRMVMEALPLDGDANHPNKTRQEAMDEFGFEGYGFEAAINNQIGAERVTWMHGGREDHSALEAVERSGVNDPAMLVVYHPLGQHWLVTLGKDEGGTKGRFVDPSDGMEWQVKMEDIRKGIYYQNTNFKQNGYLSK